MTLGRTNAIIGGDDMGYLLVDDRFNLDVAHYISFTFPSTTTSCAYKLDYKRNSNGGFKYFKIIGAYTSPTGEYIEAFIPRDDNKLYHQKTVGLYGTSSQPTIGSTFYRTRYECSYKLNTTAISAVSAHRLNTGTIAYSISRIPKSVCPVRVTAYITYVGGGSSSAPTSSMYTTSKTGEVADKFSTERNLSEYTFTFDLDDATVSNLDLSKIPDWLYVTGDRITYSIIDVKPL